MSKLDRFSLSRNLPSAVDFAKVNLNKGKRLLVCCSNGENTLYLTTITINSPIWDENPPKRVDRLGEHVSSNLLSCWANCSLVAFQTSFSYLYTSIFVTLFKLFIYCQSCLMVYEDVKHDLMQHF